MTLTNNFYFPPSKGILFSRFTLTRSTYTIPLLEQYKILFQKHRMMKRMKVNSRDGFLESFVSPHGIWLLINQRNRGNSAVFKTLFQD